MKVHIQRRRRTSATPPRSSSQNPAAASAARAAGTAPIRIRNTALTRNDTASTPIAAPGPIVTTSRPPSVGPSTVPTFCASPISAFACCRCSGPATWGMSPPAAGRKNASKTP